MIKICYFPTLNSPICLWRIENYATELLKFEDDCRVFVDYFYNPDDSIAWDKICLMDFDDAIIIRQRIKGAFLHFDVIIFQKIQSKEALKLISGYKERFPKVKVLMETDDSIGDITPSNLHVEKFTNEHSLAAEHAKISDAIICSTDYLAKSVHIFNKNTYVAPNCINKDNWIIDFKELDKKDEIRCGYIGGGGHDEDLKILYKAILPILNEDNNLKLVIRSGGFRPDFLLEHSKIDFQRVAWHISKYPQKIYELNLDFAFAPLRDTNFNRCKSNIKYIEMAYMNIPILASNIEPYRLTKEKECKILLSDNNIELFRENIKIMINDHKKYSNLQEECLEKYNINNESKKLLDFLKSL